MYHVTARILACRGPARSRGRGASNRPSSMHVDDFERQKAAGSPPGAPAAAAQPHSHLPPGAVKDERPETVKKVTSCPWSLPTDPAACWALEHFVERLRRTCWHRQHDYLRRHGQRLGCVSPKRSITAADLPCTSRGVQGICPCSGADCVVPCTHTGGRQQQGGQRQGSDPGQPGGRGGAVPGPQTPAAAAGGEPGPDLGPQVSPGQMSCFGDSAKNLTNRCQGVVRRLLLNSVRSADLSFVLDSDL
jgi:hypothetical protein